MRLNWKGSHAGGSEESRLVGSEDNHTLSGSTSASCTAKAVDILLARGGKANLHDKCHSVHNIVQMGVAATCKSN